MVFVDNVVKLTGVSMDILCYKFVLCSLLHMHIYVYVTYTFSHIHSQAVVVSDVIVLYLLKKRSFYREKKYLNVVDPEKEDNGYEVITEPEEYGEKVWENPALLPSALARGN